MVDLYSAFSMDLTCSNSKALYNDQFTPTADRKQIYTYICVPIKKGSYKKECTSIKIINIVFCKRILCLHEVERVLVTISDFY